MSLLTRSVGPSGGSWAWATQGLHMILAQDSVTLSSTFCPSVSKVLWRWASGDGGRRKMALGAASHGPTHRRSGQDGRSTVYLRHGLGLAATLMTEQPSSGIALLPPLGEGSRKGDLKKACLTSSCQHTAADWTSTTRSKLRRKNNKGYEIHPPEKHLMCWSLEHQDSHGQ